MEALKDLEQHLKRLKDAILDPLKSKRLEEVPPELMGRIEALVE